MIWTAIPLLCGWFTASPLGKSTLFPLNLAEHLWPFLADSELVTDVTALRTPNWTAAMHLSLKTI